MGMKWTAFLRLKGETQGGKKEGVPDEVVRLAQFLRSVNTEYNLIFHVEAEGSGVVHPLDSELSFEAWARGEESDS
ncbi:MAG TPA: hypothetical protein VFV92_06545 [Candidatus Bathyarchaeia archaeon]|nr:hypothetical protein [Candidatus Bathyarchaeia archaeon]